MSFTTRINGQVISMSTNNKIRILLTFISIPVLLAGCLSGISGEKASNQPPEVWLSSGPPELSVNEYYIHFFWGGWDADGEIDHFQYLITDNPPEGLIINDELFDAFEDPNVGEYFFYPWEELENRPPDMPAKTPVWEGRVLLHKPDPEQGRPEPYFCDENGDPLPSDERGVVHPRISETRKLWNGILMRGRLIAPSDSTFLFSADVLVDTTNPGWIAEFRRTHTFFIRAVDEEGMPTARDRIAYRTFTSRTLSPTLDISIPSRTGPGNPALVPPITNFRWTAKDYIDAENNKQDPDSVRWILVPFINNSFDETVDFIRRAPDSAWTSVSQKWPSGWIPYDAPGDSGKSAVSYTMQVNTNYVFAAQAKDEAGAVTSVFDEKHNLRRVLASFRTTGPKLTVFNKFLGTLTSSSIRTPIIIFDLPEGIPMQFKWRASASSYGGVVVGYRYGWDIENLDDDTQWETDYTPFEREGAYAYSPTRTFFFGTHTFHVEVKDNSGFKSRAGVRVNVVPFTMERDLLMVDDFQDSDIGIIGTRGALPNDEEHDAFWLEMLSDLATFNPVEDFIEVDKNSVLPITTLAKYKNIIWNVYGNHAFSIVNTPTMLYRLIKFNNPNETQSSSGKVEPNLLALYMAAGGHLLLCGYQPMSMSVNRKYFIGGGRYPFIILYESAGDQDGKYDDGPVGATSFPYNEYCLDVMDVAYTAASNRNDFCRVSRRSPKIDGMREVLIDDTDVLNGRALPSRIVMDSTLTRPGWVFYDQGINSEIYNPRYFLACDTTLVPYASSFRYCFKPMFRQKTISGSSIVDNDVVGYWTSRFADVQPNNGIPARSALWGFEPYYFNKKQIKQALDFIIFGEWQLPQK